MQVGGGQDIIVPRAEATASDHMGRRGDECGNECGDDYADPSGGHPQLPGSGQQPSGGRRWPMRARHLRILRADATTMRLDQQ